MFFPSPCWSSWSRREDWSGMYYYRSLAIISVPVRVLNLFFFSENSNLIVRGVANFFHSCGWTVSCLTSVHLMDIVPGLTFWPVSTKRRPTGFHVQNWHDWFRRFTTLTKPNAAIHDRSLVHRKYETIKLSNGRGWSNRTNQENISKQHTSPRERTSTPYLPNSRPSCFIPFDRITSEEYTTIPLEEWKFSQSQL